MAQGVCCTNGRDLVYAVLAYLKASNRHGIRVRLGPQYVRAT